MNPTEPSTSQSEPLTTSSSIEMNVPKVLDPLQKEYMQTIAIVLDEANLAFAQRKYELATTLFSQVAEAYEQFYGSPTHPRCADVLFRYGRALLNHAIERSGLLGDAEQLKNATGKREKDLLSVVDDVVTSDILPSSNNKHFHFGGEPAPVEEEVEHTADDDQEEGDEEEEDIETDDFEVAFDVLDVARIIYERMLTGEIEPPADLFTSENESFNGQTKGKGKAKAEEDPSLMKTIQRRHAEVIATLADVSLESESFSQAVGDYRTTLKLQEELLEPSNRRLAETHYKLALAIEYASEEPLEEALIHLEKSHKVLLARKEYLLSQESKDNHKEVVDIDELLPELTLKIEDVKQQIYIRDHPEADEASSILAEESKLGTAQLDAKSVPINDLSNLIKKKPSNASTSSDTVNVDKKRKLDTDSSVVSDETNSPKKIKMNEE